MISHTPTLGPHDAKPKRAISEPRTRIVGPPPSPSILIDPFDAAHDDPTTPLGLSTAHAVKMRYIHSEERLQIPDNGEHEH